jgi:hypothetical protein
MPARKKTSRTVDHAIFDTSQRYGKLYHYTSAEAFLSILASQALWATSVTATNDSQEFVYALETMSELVSEARSAGRLSIELAVSLEAGIDRVKAVPACVFSLSRERDLLSQWRAYAFPAGLCIGFDLEIVTAMRSYQGGEMLIFECMYGRTEQRKLLAKILTSEVNRRSNRGTIRSRQRSTALDCSYSFEDRLTFAAARMKHPAFIEERECRMVWLVNRSSSGGLSLRSSASGLIPYGKLEIDASPSNYVNEIILPPAQRRAAISDIASGLRGLGITCPIVQSQVPLTPASRK